MLSIEAPESYSGKSLLLRANVNGERVYPTWTITSGGQYASVNASGKLDITSGASNRPVTVQAVYGSLSAVATIYVTYTADVTIACADTITGTSGNYTVLLDGTDVTATALITKLSGPATFSAGDITFSQSGTVQFYATVQSYTSPVKTVNLVYNSSAETETVVAPDGTTTTTTVIEETDPQTGQITTTETTVVTNPDGSESQTQSETVENQDGSSTTTSTTVNSDGTTSETQGTTSAPDPVTGSTTSQSETVNYDANGDPTGSSTNTTTNNTDGSSSSSTTNYNAEGDPTDQTNQDTDSSGNVDTQSVEFDENGDPTVTGYTIDTTSNPNGGKDITGDGVNTEFVPFDSSDGFELHIRFKSRKQDQPNPPLVVDTEDTGANLHFTILCSKSPFKPWPGFHIRWTLNKNNYTNGNLVFGYTSASANNSTNRNLALSRNNDVYDFTIAYDPNLIKYPSMFRCQDNLNGSALITLNVDFKPLEYPLTIGYNITQQGQPYRYSNVEVLEFSVTKIRPE